MKPTMAMIEERLDNGPWWYGETWSIVDGYLFWAWSRIAGVGFPQDAFPNLRSHAERIVQRPSVARAMAREEENIKQLEEEGLYRAPK